MIENWLCLELVNINKISDSLHFVRYISEN